jgi:hypothetical protein
MAPGEIALFMVCYLGAWNSCVLGMEFHQTSAELLSQLTDTLADPDLLVNDPSLLRQRMQSSTRSVYDNLQRTQITDAEDPSKHAKPTTQKEPDRAHQAGAPQPSNTKQHASNEEPRKQKMQGKRQRNASTRHAHQTSHPLSKQEEAKMLIQSLQQKLKTPTKSPEFHEVDHLREANNLDTQRSLTTFAGTLDLGSQFSEHDISLAEKELSSATVLPNQPGIGDSDEGTALQASQNKIAGSLHSAQHALANMRAKMKALQANQQNVIENAHDTLKVPSKPKRLQAEVSQQQALQGKQLQPSAPSRPHHSSKPASSWDSLAAAARQASKRAQMHSEPASASTQQSHLTGRPSKMLINTHTHGVSKSTSKHRAKHAGSKHRAKHVALKAKEVDEKQSQWEKQLLSSRDAHGHTNVETGSTDEDKMQHKDQQEKMTTRKVKVNEDVPLQANPSEEVEKKATAAPGFATEHEAKHAAMVKETPDKTETSKSAKNMHDVSKMSTPRNEVAAGAGIQKESIHKVDMKNPGQLAAELAKVHAVMSSVESDLDRAKTRDTQETKASSSQRPRDTSQDSGTTSSQIEKKSSQDEEKSSADERGAPKSAAMPVKDSSKTREAEIFDALTRAATEGDSAAFEKVAEHIGSPSASDLMALYMD